MAKLRYPHGRESRGLLKRAVSGRVARKRKKRGCPMGWEGKTSLPTVFSLNFEGLWRLSAWSMRRIGGSGALLFSPKKRAFFVIQSWYPFGTADDHSAASPMSSAEFSPPARGWAFLRRFSVSLTEQNPAYAGMDPEVELSSRRTKAEPRLHGGCPVFAPWGFSVGLFCGCIAGGPRELPLSAAKFF